MRNNSRAKKCAAIMMILLLGGMMMFNLFGCKAQSKPYAFDGEQDVMLVDYYTATLGTDGYDSHSEMALYSYSDTQVKLSVYNGAEGEEETREDYLVPTSVVDECYRAIDSGDFRNWSKLKNTTALDGGRTAVKFRDGDDYIRVSTDDMPEDGERLLDQVGIVMRGYVIEEYLMK